jgi:tetratricopeptide (TPR) repeat protein
MPVRRAIPILFLALATVPCGADEKAARDCSAPPTWPRQVEACTQVIAADPRSSEAYSNRCQAYNQLEQPAKAIPDCDMAIRLDPRSAEAYNNRGWAYEIRRDFDLALKDYDKAIELDPRFAQAYANRGDVHAKRGDRQRAIAEYRRALAIEPGNGVALGGLQRLGVRP